MSAPADPTVRRLRARLGAYAQQAAHGPNTMQAARDGFRAKLLAQVQAAYPDLSPTEHGLRAEALWRLHLTRAALKSAAIRKARHAGREGQAR